MQLSPIDIPSQTTRKGRSKSTRISLAMLNRHLCHWWKTCQMGAVAMMSVNHLNVSPYWTEPRGCGYWGWRRTASSYPVRGCNTRQQLSRGNEQRPCSSGRNGRSQTREQRWARSSNPGWQQSTGLSWTTGRPPYVFVVACNNCWRKTMLKSMARIEEI